MKSQEDAFAADDEKDNGGKFHSCHSSKSSNVGCPDSMDLDELRSAPRARPLAGDERTAASVIHNEIRFENDSDSCLATWNDYAGAVLAVPLTTAAHGRYNIVSKTFLAMGR